MPLRVSDEYVTVFVADEQNAAICMHFGASMGSWVKVKNLRREIYIYMDERICFCLFLSLRNEDTGPNHWRSLGAVIAATSLFLTWRLFSSITDCILIRWFTTNRTIDFYTTTFTCHVGRFVGLIEFFRVLLGAGDSNGWAVSSCRDGCLFTSRASQNVQTFQQYLFLMNLSRAISSACVASVLKQRSCVVCTVKRKQRVIW